MKLVTYSFFRLGYFIVSCSPHLPNFHFKLIILYVIFFLLYIFKCYQFYSDFWHICNRDDVLILTYEYVLKNKEEVFQNLAKFMDIPTLKKEEMKLILEKTSKEWMYN